MIKSIVANLEKECEPTCELCGNTIEHGESRTVYDGDLCHTECALQDIDMGDWQ